MVVIATPVEVDLSRLPGLTNEAFYPLYSNDSRYLVMYGGAGSGKSVFAAQKIVFRVLTETPHKFLVVRKVGRTLRHSVFAEIKNIINTWGLESLFKINKSDMEITCINGNEIIFGGLDDVEKLKSIQGITSVWIEEASEISLDDFSQLDLRVRGRTAHYKQYQITFNPISQLSWLKTRFFDTRDEETTHILKTTYRDNKFLGPEDREAIERYKEQDYTYYQIYGLGEWGVLGDLVFSNYEMHDFPTDHLWFRKVYQGIDFGHNHPSAFIKVGYKDDEIYLFDEICVKGITNDEWILECSHLGDKRIQTTADCAEPDRIKEFKQAGWKVAGTVKGKDSVRHGLDWMIRRKIHIHPNSQQVLNEMQAYHYHKDKDGIVHDDPVPLNDDTICAARYAIEPLRRQMPSKTSLAANQVLTRLSPWRM